MREVAQAHTRALSEGTAHGRYLIQSADVHYSEIARMLRKNPLLIDVPVLPVDASGGVARAPLIGASFDVSRVRSLGVLPIEIEKTLFDAAGALVQFGYDFKPPKRNIPLACEPKSVSGIRLAFFLVAAMGIAAGAFKVCSPNKRSCASRR